MRFLLRHLLARAAWAQVRSAQGGTTFDDPGALLYGQTWNYRIETANACGGESAE